MASVAWLLQPASECINRVIHLDPAAADGLSALDGRTLQLRLTDLDVAVHVAFSPDGLTLAEADDGAGADVQVAGRLTDLLAMARDPDSGGGRVAFTGDPAVAREVRGFFRGLDLDWEEQLARVMGDAPAHQAGRFLRGLGDWLQDAGTRTWNGLGEYLTEEQRTLPSRPEVEGFLDDVDRLRADTDRLAARVARLERRRSERS